MLVGEAYNQTATYWAPSYPGGYGGEVFVAPSTLLVRWENSREIYTNNEGEEVVSNAVVYSLVELEEGGYLYKGSSVSADPKDVSGAYQIKRTYSIPDIRNLEQENRNYL